MKKIIIMTILSTMIFSCGTNINPELEKANPVKITRTNVITNVTNIKKSTVEIIKKELKRDVNPDDLTYEVSDKKLASITDQGEIIPLGNGEVDIIVKEKANGKEIKKIRVGVQIHETPVLKLKQGKSISLNLEQNSVVWKSTNISVAELNSSKITAIATGETDIIGIDSSTNKEISKIKILVNKDTYSSDSKINNLILPSDKNNTSTESPLNNNISNNINEPIKTPLPDISTSSTTVSIERTSFNGKVYSENGAPLDNVIVSAKSLDSSFSWKSEEQYTIGGSFVFRNVPVGIRIEITTTINGISKSRIEVLRSNINGNPNFNVFDFGGSDPVSSTYAFSV